MASINIYVTDELKEQMGGVETNWSEVCRRAIESELERLTLEAEVSDPPSTEGNEDWKQIAFNQSLLDQGVIIKPSMAPNYTGTSPKEVTNLSTWLNDINKAIGTPGVGGAQISQLLDGTYPAGILIPGRPWLSGRLKLQQRFVFSYPPSEETV
ncbi:hypothetical protein ACKFKG_23510 [Phormidesmis sp. 146-35]